MAKRKMGWKYRDGAWHYGDGIHKDIYKASQVGGRWIVFLKGVEIEDFHSLDEVKHFVPRHYVESAIKRKEIKKIA